MNKISLENEIIIVSTETIHKLFQYNNWSDVVALYLFYHKQCKIQKTNQSWTTWIFIKKWMNISKQRITDARAVLKELWLIEDIKDTTKDWKWYVKLNYIKSSTVKDNLNLPENELVQNWTCSSGDTNAWSSKSLNAWSSKSLNALFEEFWKLYPNKKEKKGSLKAYKKYYKQHKEIMSWLENYIKFIKYKKQEDFIKHPSTWLNGECWNDEYETWTDEYYKYPYKTQKEYEDNKTAYSYKWESYSITDFNKLTQEEQNALLLKQANNE